MSTGNAILDPVGVFLELGRIGKWIQAVGLLVILWIIVQSIRLYFDRRRRKAIFAIRADVKRLEEKFDKLSKRIRKK